MLQNQNTKVLITGATGYVGSHVTKLLNQLGYKTIVVDRNVNSRIYTIEQLSETVFYEMSYGDEDKMSTVFESEKPDVVVHLAANSLVGPSVTDPHKYYQNNVSGTISLLGLCVNRHAATDHAVGRAGDVGAELHPGLGRLKLDPDGLQVGDDRVLLHLTAAEQPEHAPWETLGDGPTEVEPKPAFTVMPELRRPQMRPGPLLQRLVVLVHERCDGVLRGRDLHARWAQGGALPAGG